MTTTVINNVPRDLLADLLGNDHDKRIMAERHLLAMLANAPSPAGVGGLEVKRLSIAGVRSLIECSDGELARYSDVERLLAIIDGLRGEVAQLQSMLATVSKAGIRVRTDRDQQAQRIGELGGLLRSCLPALSDGGCAALANRIDAALSAGKEGE